MMARFLILLIVPFLLAMPQEAVSQYTITNELPGVGISDIEVDKDGTLWILTWHPQGEGRLLQKYEGSDWISYPEYHVTDMTTDENGLLWFSSVFDDEEGQSCHIYHMNDQEFTIAATIKYRECHFVVHDFNIWVYRSYTRTGDLAGAVFHWDGATWHQYTTDDGLVDNAVQCAVFDSSGTIWFGTANGLSQFDGTTWITCTTENGLLDNHIRSLFIDSKGQLWCGMREGLSVMHNGSWTHYQASIYYEDYDTYIGPYAITEDKSGDIWFGHGHGVGHVVGSSLSDLRYHEHINYDNVFSVNMIACDQDNTIWYAGRTGAEGLFKLVQEPSSVESPELTPVSFDLSCFPNPFNPATTITYTLPSASGVTLAVYNLSGQNVATLVDERQAAGTHTAAFDGTGLASGLYFARLEAGGAVKTEKMMLMK